MEHVLVTGATGFVGSHLCEELVKQGYKVKALVRESSNKSFLDTLGVEYIYGDLRDLEKLKENLKGIDVVFHCAAQVGLVETYDQEHASTNIQGTRNILEASVLNNIKRFVYVSTLGVLGILRDHYNDDETAPYVKVGNPYFDTKIDAERLVINYYNDKNLPTVILRPGYIYGTRDRNGLPYFIPYLLKGQLVCVGHGNNDVALTSVKNLVQAMLLAATKDEAKGKIYNITDGTGITSMQFLKELAKILELNEPKRKVPISAAKALAKGTQLVNKNLPLNDYVVAMVSNSFNFDISKARKDLGYNPVDNFEEELREAVEWYVKNNTKQVDASKKVARTTKYAALGVTAGVAGLFLLYLKNKLTSSNK